MANRLEVAKYPEDKTGNSPDNLVRGEPHTLSNEGVRSVIPKAGPFYTESMDLVDMATGQSLEPNVQFKAIELLAKATQQTGKEICCAIIITDQNVSDNVEFTYQCIGGAFINASQPLQTLIDNLNLGERPVAWGDILDKPGAFPPAAHLHDIGDVYGFEDVVYVLEAIRYAILIGDEASHDALRKLIADRFDELDDLLNKHIGDKENPHRTTKAQVGLGEVDNYPTADAQEAYDMKRDDRFMTPLRSADSIRHHSETRDHPYATAQEQGMVKLSTTAATALGEADNLAVDPKSYAQSLNLDLSIYGPMRDQIITLIEDLATRPLVGRWFWDMTSVIPGRYLPPHGKLYKREDYKMAWAYIQTSGRLISDSQWASNKGCYSSGDGSTTFRMPELRGRYPRVHDDRVSDPVAGFLEQTVMRHNHSASSSRHSGHSHAGSTNKSGEHTHKGITVKEGSHGHSGRTNSAGSHSHPFGVVKARDAGGYRGPYIGWGNALDADHRSNLYNSDASRAGIGSAGSHNHSISIDDGGAHSHGLVINPDGLHDHTVTVSNGGAHDHQITVNNTGDDENRPNSVLMNFVMYAGPH